MFQNGQEIKSCAWVKEDKEKYCGSAYEGPKDNCPLTCGLCDNPVPSKPSLMPTSSPSMHPTISLPPSGTVSVEPSIVPTLSPTPAKSWCCDSEKDFDIQLYSGKLSKNCSWIALKKSRRCRFSEAKLNCPLTCHYCRCSNNPGTFLVKSSLFVGGEMYQTCDWVKTDSEKYCGPEYDGTIENCPQVCGRCKNPVTLAPSMLLENPSSTPSHMPSPMPSHKPSPMPSHIPTGEPSDTSVCAIANFYGDTIYGRTNDHTCMKLEVFPNGSLSIHLHTSQTKSCDEISNYMNISKFDEIDASNNQVVYTKNGIALHGWDAKFEIVVDKTLSSNALNILVDNAAKAKLEALLLIPFCTRNAVSPQAAPSRMLNRIPLTVLDAIPTAKAVKVPIRTDNCNVTNLQWIGDGICDDDSPGYYTKECEWDGGDCDNLKELYEDCPGPLAWLGDGECDDYEFKNAVSLNLNVPACEFDLGDCKGDHSYRRSISKRQAKDAALRRLELVRNDDLVHVGR